MSSDGLFPHLGDLAEVRTKNAVGGRRGVYAKQDISPGQVIFQEEPLMATLSKRMRDEEPIFIQLARRILQNKQRDTLLQKIEPLYPQSLSELTPEMLEKAKTKHAGALSYLHEVQAAPKLSEDQLLCILLKVCFSAFCGGLYVKKAMLNHCCRPNCMAFQPGQRMSSSGRIMNAKSSEVVATRHIAKDEEVTICYFVPMERSHMSRSRLFEDQHLCPLEPSPWPREMEAFAHEQDPDFDRETAKATLLQLEADLDELDEVLESGDLSHEEALGYLDGDALVVAHELLAPTHLVRCRINAMVVRSCHALAEAGDQDDDRLGGPPDGGQGGAAVAGESGGDGGGGAGAGGDGSKGGEEEGVDGSAGEGASGGGGGGGARAAEAVVRMLRACLELRAVLTDEVMGKGHCEVARILCDTHVALDFLLSHADKLLYSYFPGRLDTWQKASKAEYAARREYQRIAKLYDPPAAAARS